MFNLNLAHSAKPSQISLVHGYFLTIFPSFAPIEIIETCILYCFLLESFDSDETCHSKQIQIDSLHGVICECTSLSQQVQYAVGHNILGQQTTDKAASTKITAGEFCRIKQPLPAARGSRIVKTVSYDADTKYWKVLNFLQYKSLSDNTLAMEFKEEHLEALTNYNPREKLYHWRFRLHSISGPEGGGIIFGVVANDPQQFNSRLTMSSSLTSTSVKPDDYVDCYLDLNEQSLTLIRNGWDFMDTITVYTNCSGYRFCIQFIESVGKLEFIEYHESNWYLHNIRRDITAANDVVTISRSQALCHAGLAMTHPLVEFEHFVIALSLFPYYQRWVDGLIFGIICGETNDYEVSYQTALRYQAEGKGGESVCYLARVYYNQGLYAGALNMLRLMDAEFISKHKLNNVMAICLAVTGHKAESVKYLDIHSKDMNEDEKKSMSIDQIAFCYEDVDDEKAIEYYLKALNNSERLNRLDWIRGRLAALYAKKKDLFHADENYAKIIELKPEDYSSYFEYADFLCNVAKKKEESEPFYTKALQMAIGSAGGNEEAVLTVIDCYRALNQPQLAIEYLRLYMENHDQDNIGIVSILKDCYINVGDYDNAILCLDKIFKINSDVFAYNFEYAELLRVYDKDESKSKIYYQKAIHLGLKSLQLNADDSKRDDESISNVYDIVSVCYEYLGEAQNAIKYCLLAVDKKPNDVLIMNKIANMYYKKKEFENARKWFLKAIAVGDENINYLTYYDYAMCLQDMKQIEESRIFTQKSIDACIKLKAERKEANLEKDVTEYIHISSCFVQLKQYKNVRQWLDGADAVIKQLASLSDNSSISEDLIDEMHLNSSLCYLLADKEYELALENLLLIDKEMLKKCGLYAVASCIYRGLRDVESALECCQTGIDASSDLNGIMIHMAMAFLLNERGEYDQADEHFNVALAIDCELKDFELIESYSESLDHYRYDYNKSLFYANILREIAADITEKCRAMMRLAIVYHHLNDSEKSKEYFNSGMKYAAKIENELEYEHLLQTIGYYYLITKQYESAHKFLFRAYKIDAREPGITGLLGICLYEMKREQDSKPYLKQSLQDVIEKRDPFIAPKCLEYFSRILFDEKEYEKCMKFIEKLRNRNDFEKRHPHKDEVYYLQSRCYSKFTQFDQAYQCLMKANQINPERKLYKNQMKMIKEMKVSVHDEYI